MAHADGQSVWVGTLGYSNVTAMRRAVPPPGRANPSQLCSNNDTRIAAADLYTLSPELVRDIVWDFLDFDLIQRSSWTKIAGFNTSY